MEKTLEKLNLIDSFLFREAMDHATYGPDIARIILETILGRKIVIKQLIAEKAVHPSDPKFHGVRLDALIEEESAKVEPGDLFDLEPEKKEYEKKLLPFRSRYYHSMMDGRLLWSGKKYNELARAWVIFITPFDPFGRGRMVYTIRNQCVELPELDYDDGATTLYLYTNGKNGEYTEELQELLTYFADSSERNACNKDLKKIHEYLSDIKEDPETRDKYMTMEEYIARERREAAEEEKTRADQEKTRADQEKTRADQEKTRADQEKTRADQEKARADQEKARADQEKARADAAEEEIRRLKSELP